MAEPVFIDASIDYDGHQWFTSDPAVVRVVAKDPQGAGLEGTVVVGVIKDGTVQFQKTGDTDAQGRASFVVEVSSPGDYQIEVAFSDGVHEGSVSAGTHNVRGAAGLTFSPILSNLTATATGVSTGEASVRTDTGTGDIFWVASRLSSTPTKTQVENGNRADGQAAADSGTISLLSDGEKGISIDGLTPGVSYTVFVFQRDGGGRESSIVSASFTTTTSQQNKGELLYPKNTITTTVF